MARFNGSVPEEIILNVEKRQRTAHQMAQEMTQAGAKVVYNNIQSKVPKGIRDSRMMQCLKITKPYDTNAGAVASKVAFYGYFTNKRGVKTPAPLVANVTEYGNSAGTYPKKPFLRSSFKAKEINAAMESVQDKYFKE